MSGSAKGGKIRPIFGMVDEFKIDPKTGRPGRGAKFKTGKEELVSALVIGEKDSIRVYSGKKPKIIRPDEFDHYMSERGKRGRSVPPFKKIDRLTIEPK